MSPKTKYKFQAVCQTKFYRRNRN